MTPAEVRAWVAETRRRQGLPDHVTDATVLAHLAAAVAGAQVEKGGADAVA